jgi:hypothetical protein
MIETCARCGEEGTPWAFDEELNGHVCNDCHDVVEHFKEKVYAVLNKYRVGYKHSDKKNIIKEVKIAIKNLFGNKLTAKQFRELGHPPSSDIPDEAWVPTNSLKYEVTVDSNGTIWVSSLLTQPFITSEENQ